MYKVIKGFTDTQDNGYEYNVGDEFPRKGIEVSDYRIGRLASDRNRQRVPLIEEVKGSAKSLDPAHNTQPSSQPSPKVEKEVTPLKNEVKRSRKSKKD